MTLGRVSWYAAIFVFWIAGIAILGTQGTEPYPGLFQPGFAVKKGEQKQSTLRVEYLVHTDEGTQSVDPADIFYPAGDNLGMTLLGRADTDDPEVSSWLADRVKPLVDGHAHDLRVTWWEGDRLFLRKDFDLQ